MPSLMCGHVPWPRLAEHRAYLLEQRINPELYLPAEALDCFDTSLAAEFGRELEQHGLACTFHAPFLDLNPGSLDTVVRAATRQRVEQTFAAAALLRPRVIVFHPGYSRLTYGSAVDAWVDNSVAFWQAQLPRLRDLGCTAALENIFEEEPATLLRVLEGIGDPCVGHCFDAGHFNMFATVSLEDWFMALGDRIVESHLHDNHGEADEHLPLGEGLVDFALVTGLLQRYAPQAVWTLEAHSRERLERSFAAVAQYL